MLALAARVPYEHIIPQLDGLSDYSRGRPGHRGSRRCPVSAPGCAGSCRPENQRVSRKRFGRSAACFVQRFWVGLASSLAFPPWRGCPGLGFTDRGLELLALVFLLVADFPKNGPSGPSPAAVHPTARFCQAGLLDCRSSNTPRVGLLMLRRADIGDIVPRHWQHDRLLIAVN
jgi:hypothetical protein